jgi:hypothetical protein
VRVSEKLAYVRHSMRFGCCVNMLVPLGEGTGAELVEKVAAAGFDYLELPLVRIAVLTDQKLRRSAGESRRRGFGARLATTFSHPTCGLPGKTRICRRPSPTHGMR